MTSIVTSGAAEQAESAGAAARPPACILDLWDLPGWSDACAGVMANLLLRRPGLVDELTDLTSFISHLRNELAAALAAQDTAGAAAGLRAPSAILTIAGRRGELVDLYRESLGRLIHANATSPNPEPVVDGIGRELIGMYQSAGRDKDAFELQYRLRVLPMLARAVAAEFQSLRSFALNAYQVGCFAEAETIYRQLLRLPEEQANTHCHLARVLICMGRFGDAASEVERGWTRREGAEAYVLARLLYLRALLQTLERGSAEATVNELRRMLQDREVVFEWTLAPMLELVRRWLTVDGYEFFARLGRLLSSGKRD